MLGKKLRGWRAVGILAALALVLAFSFSGWAENND